MLTFYFQNRIVKTKQGMVHLQAVATSVADPEEAVEDLAVAEDLVVMVHHHQLLLLQELNCTSAM